MQVAGINEIYLVPVSAVLVIAIAVILIKKTTGMRKRRAEGEPEDEEVDIEDKLEHIESDKVQQYKAKIDQLAKSLSLEREKLKAKETQVKEQEQNYENDLLKVVALKDEAIFLTKGEVNNLVSWPKVYA